MIPWLKKYIHPYFVDIASACSIIGVLIVLFSEEYAVIIALITFCLSLLIIIIGFIIAVNSFVKRNYEEDYRRVSSSYVFQTDDGVKSTFEMYRLIQCKRPILNQIEYKFKWSGSIDPKITSENQEVVEIIKGKDSSVWDKAILKFKKPLSYNESTVLHVKTQNDDVDGIAKPYLECRLDSPIEIMQYRVLLAYKNNRFDKKALFKRRKIDAETTVDYEILESVDFDQKYKQYSFIKLNPDPGYIYRLEWEK